MALATAINTSTDILLVSEPNKNMMKPNEWIYDEQKDTGIRIFNHNLNIRNQGEGDGITYIVTPDFTLCSCYASGNRDLNHLDDLLDQISSLIRSAQGKTIIVGDFNAKSPQWGMTKTDTRGAVMEDWIAQNDLIIMNDGDKPTFQVESYSSVLDLTLATSDLKEQIQKWDVLEEDSLSDHNYITFEFKKLEKPPRTRPTFKGWQTRKFNKTALNQKVSELNWDNAVISAGHFSTRLKQLCNASMPKRNTHPNRKPVYWWTQEVEELRRQCLRKRRLYTRASKNGNLAIRTTTWLHFQTARKILRNNVKKAKRSSWKNLCEEINNEIWGQGYKIVMKQVIGLPKIQHLTIDGMERIARELFATVPNYCDNLSVITKDQTVIENCDNNTVIFLEFTSEELQEACGKLKNKKAPGPQFIPPEILKLIASSKTDYVMSVYNDLARRGLFPPQWKTAKLVLIQKGNKPIGEPRSFRPLSLLDVEGKLYELLILGRLEKEIERTGGLSENQFGFRKGRQTADAVGTVIRLAEQANSYTWKHRRICAVVMLDVRNAFNCASWKQICEALRKRGIDEGLYRIIDSYLSDRTIILETGDEKRVIQLAGGVPQGSILGPTLWNILYDDLFKIDLPQEANLLGFADDVALIVTAKTEEALVENTNTALQNVENWMATKHLHLAPEKSEAVLLTRKRKMTEIVFQLNGTNIRPKVAAKYLGVWLDTKLSFSYHVGKIEEKVLKTISALSRIMPNIGGPKASTRIILASVAQSQILYAAPVYYPAFENKKLCNKLLSLQRKLNIRISSAYRTISGAAAGVIAGNPPIDLMALERKEKYEGKDKKEARKDLIDRWQTRWDCETRGIWTKKLIPNIDRWLNRSYGDIDYYITQALSGHGTFNKYLFDRGKRESAECNYCHEAEDDVEHTLFECPRWTVIREEYRIKTGEMFELNVVKRNLLAVKEKWSAMYETIKFIMNTKEREDTK